MCARASASSNSSRLASVHEHWGCASRTSVGPLVERVTEAELATVNHDRFLVPLALDNTAFTDGAVR